MDGNFVFASEIKCLLEFPGFKRKVNQAALEEYLSFQYSALEETLFKGVYRLLPGHFLTYEDGNLKIEKYFDPMLTPKNMGDDEQIVDRIEKVMKDSVDHHMIADVEVGAFLSGGVDSSYIAAEFSGNKAFTVGFLDEKNHYSEISYAKDLAKELGLEHHTKIISKEEYWDAIPKIMWHLDEPSGDAAAIALYFVAQEAAKYVKVVTSGEGSDELFGGYTIYHEPMSLKYYTWLPKGFRKAVGKLARKLPDVKGKSFLIRGSKDVQERFIGNANIFTNKERRKLLKNRTGAPTTEKLLQPIYDRASKLDDMNKMQYVDLNCWLPGDILQKADRMSMAHSLELRVPFLDKEVFKIARCLPTKAKIRGNQTKYLFRKASEHVLPEVTAERKKLGFPVPIRVWIKEESWYSEIKELFTSEAAEEFFNTDILVGLLEEHKAGHKDNSRKIWTVFSFLTWHKVFFEDGLKESEKKAAPEDVKEEEKTA